MKIPIHFPILIRFGRKLIASREDIVKYWGIKHEGDNRLSYKDSAKSYKDSQKASYRFHWLIDADGLYREFKDMGYSRTWARGIKQFIRLTRVQCELSQGRLLKIAELKQKIGTLKMSSQSDFQHGQSLLAFLDNHPEEDDFTPELFLEFMGEPQRKHQD